MPPSTGLCTAATGAAHEAWAYVKQDEKELPTVERPARTLNVHRGSLYGWAKPIADDEQVDPEIAELARTVRSTRGALPVFPPVGFPEPVGARNCAHSP